MTDDERNNAITEAGESPDMEAPDAESTKVESPDAAPPDVEAPDGESPDAKSPDAESADAKPARKKSAGKKSAHKKSAGKRSAGKKAAPEKPQKIGPITDQSGKRTSKHGGAGRLTDFTQLPDLIKREAERLLTNGFTFEEVTEWINQRHAPEKPDEPKGITLSAVQDYFRDNLDIQRRRVLRMQEVSKELKKHLAHEDDPRTALADLADAVFLTGIMGLHNAGAEFHVRDAQRHFLDRERLHQQGRMTDAKLTTEELRQDHLRKKLRDLEGAIRQETGGRQLRRGTLRRIREIYGLLESAPEAPPPDAQPVEASAPASSVANEGS